MKKISFCCTIFIFLTFNVNPNSLLEKKLNSFFLSSDKSESLKSKGKTIKGKRILKKARKKFLKSVQNIKIILSNVYNRDTSAYVIVLFAKIGGRIPVMIRNLGCLRASKNMKKNCTSVRKIKKKANKNFLKVLEEMQEIPSLIKHLGSEDDYKYDHDGFFSFPFTQFKITFFIYDLPYNDIENYYYVYFDEKIEKYTVVLETKNLSIVPERVNIKESSFDYSIIDILSGKAKKKYMGNKEAADSLIKK